MKFLENFKGNEERETTPCSSPFLYIRVIYPDFKTFKNYYYSANANVRERDGCPPEIQLPFPGEGLLLGQAAQPGTTSSSPPLSKQSHVTPGQGCKEEDTPSSPFLFSLLTRCQHQE